MDEEIQGLLKRECSGASHPIGKYRNDSVGFIALSVVAFGGEML